MFRIERSEAWGRHAVAAQDIKKGTVSLLLSPFTFFHLCPRLQCILLEAAAAVTRETGQAQEWALTHTLLSAGKTQTWSENFYTHRAFPREQEGSEVRSDRNCTVP